MKNRKILNNREAIFIVSSQIMMSEFQIFPY